MNKKVKSQKKRGGPSIYVPAAAVLLGERDTSRALTCDVQEERGGLRAQAVLAGGRDPVDPHRLVHVLDPVLQGADVGVGESVAVAEVQRDARSRPVTLHGTNRFRFLLVCLFVF